MLGRGHSMCKGPGVGRARLECERGQEVGGGGDALEPQELRPLHDSSKQSPL